MKITFLGTGTSQGIPVIACDCEVCISKNEKDKRLRVSVLIETENNTLVIDSGPDFRTQMLRANVQNIDGILYTHEHKDHVAGMDDVRPFCFKHKKEIEIYAHKRVLNQLKQEFHYVFDERFNYPGIPRINANVITNSPFEINGETITPIDGLHYKLQVFGFRIGDFTYITDMNAISDEEIEKVKGTKVLVLNALQKTPHISHFTLEEAIAMVKRINPEKAYFTHMSHTLGLHDEIMNELPANIELGFDGLEITI
ncbi:MBL fold metallo-hydrolase [Flavobacteriales bacterium]|jgi:phosphoribosyl 1,2-cyclic phosphate phosphodiesterase|nr:MBL fold metallo-hydrolase [Flavobacteriales bacterium]MDB4052288.1 MBL fold metallo-hydrolase [Flavobacteriales bacterium]MDB4195864.1 MBL fold metallo-hydrolase [Flavobacteriales bacterium]MDB9702381.1 MBL fold metallo-hydrolase [Flavobacteriales bacterium]MDC0015116.1 MBL fold metallo-hydrolase [Flavobacteriales bacterium]